VGTRRRAAAAVLGIFLALTACRADPATPRGTAERFLDAHYVLIDLPAARELASGLARHKVETEIEHVRGQAIDESTRKPTVHYRLLEEHADGQEAVRYVYRGSIRVEDADTFERRWLITVRHEDGGWRVTNFEELGG
jgi:hypothetical protein